MPYSFTAAPASEVAPKSASAKNSGKVLQRRAEFIDGLVTVLAELAESGEDATETVLFVPLTEGTSIQNQLSTLKRLAAYATTELAEDLGGLALRVSKRRDQDVGVIRFVVPETAETEA